MIEKFIKAKHWQLFLLMFGMPVLYHVAIIGPVLKTLGTESNPDQTIMFNQIKIFSIVMFIFTGFYFGWFWSIAMGLQRKIPEGVKMKVSKFKFFFFVPLIYILFIGVFMGSSLNELINNGVEPSGKFIGSIFAIVFLFHFLSMFGIFYALYFAAKTIKTVELQREVKFPDFAGEFFMIWFFPIGIWILQPKINKMIEE